MPTLLEFPSRDSTPAASASVPSPEGLAWSRAIAAVTAALRDEILADRLEHESFEKILAAMSTAAEHFHQSAIQTAWEGFVVGLLYADRRDLAREFRDEMHHGTLHPVKDPRILAVLGTSAPTGAS